jgi:hypothetical protein
MKTYSTLLSVCCLSFLAACSFSAGTNKDLVTGLSYSYAGFSVEKVVLVDSENTIKTDNDVVLDSKVDISVEGLVNYTLKDNKAFPGLMLLVTDKQGNPVIDEADLFSDSEGYSAEDASFLRGSVIVGNPMKSGETYHVKMRVWDKNNPENELTAEVDLDVQ